MAFIPDAQAAPSGGFVPDAPPPPNGNAVTGTRPGIVETVAPYMDPRGVPEAALSMGTGMAGQAIGGLAGLVGAALPGEPGQGARLAERVSSALTYEPRTKSGQTIMKGAELAAAPVHWAAEKAGEQGEKIGPGTATAAKTAVEAIPLALGARAAVAPKRPLTSAQSKVAEARDAGFKMTPEEMDAGFVPRTAAGLAGEPRMARALSNKNAERVLAGAKEELGLRPDAVLDLDTLKAIRKEEGIAYDAARNAGPIPMEAAYLAEIDGLTARYKKMIQDFPELASPELDKYMRSLKKEDPAVAAAEAQGIKLPQSAKGTQSFDANAGIELIGTLREAADKAYLARDANTGKILRGMSEAVENQIGRHLEATGRSDILPAFQNARKRIAKTYAVEDALIGDDIVNMRRFGSQVGDNAPLTGKLKEAGNYARNFERSSQKPNHMATGATFADLIAAGINGIRTGGGSALLDLATIGARPAVRAILESRVGQAAMDPRTNLSGPALEAVGASSALPPPQKERR